MTVDAAEVLSQTELFGHLGRTEIDSIAQHATERAFTKNQDIFHRGDHGDSLYVVVSGRVKVYVEYEPGTEMLLTTLGPHEVFGEIALLDDAGRSASAAALEATTLLTLKRVNLLELIHQNPQLADPVLRSVGETVRRLTERAWDLIFLDLPGRVAKLLLDQAATSGGARVELGLTQSDIAGLVGGSRQAVNQVLRHFQQRGYIQMDGQAIVIVKPEDLKRRATT
ncbi:MAG: family transcriptional regulator, cyclic receptor protein [Actinomycetota bacterium]|jgi:CRP-like cAMP-binding protein|nr:family transcriptional regulator, cyclic receptor protein [Actinomycetota bacterium]